MGCREDGLRRASCVLGTSTDGNEKYVLTPTQSARRCYGVPFIPSTETIPSAFAT